MLKKYPTIRHGLPAEQAHCSICWGIRAGKTCREWEGWGEKEKEREWEWERETFLVTSAWITSLPHSWTWNVKERITPQTCNTGSYRRTFFPALQQEESVHYTTHIQCASVILTLIFHVQIILPRTGHWCTFRQFFYMAENIVYCIGMTLIKSSCQNKSKLVAITGYSSTLREPFHFPITDFIRFFFLSSYHIWVHKIWGCK